MNASNEDKHWWLATKYFDELAARPVGQVAVESGLLILIAITAFGGNVLVCVSMYRNRALRTTTNLFTLCLAFSDVTNATVCLPLSIIPLIKGEWIVKINQYDVQHFACKLQATMAVTLNGFSLHIMAMTAVNRYFRVLRPGLFRKIFTKKSILTFAAVDLTVILIMIMWPSLAGAARYTFDPRRCNCFNTFNDVESSAIAAKVYIAANMGVPLCTMLFCYFRVFRAIRVHQRSIQPSLQTRGTTSLRTTVEEIKVTRIMFAVFLGFLCCWIPVIVVDTLSFQLENPHLPREPELIFTYCSALSSALNPLIYGVMNKTIRKEFVKILRCFVKQ